MTRWFALEPVGAPLFDTAPHVFRIEKHFDAPPERVWESLVSDESLAAWGPSVTAVKWTSPRPFGIGTSRDVSLGPVKVSERFFRWDDGQRYSFYVHRANAPLFRRFAEDYALTPDRAGTRFTWTIAIEPKPALALAFRALAPMLKQAFDRTAADGQKYFAAR